MSKPFIFCFVGRSGCGKTTLAERVGAALSLPIVRSYTTRKKRDGEVDGVDHRFVEERDMPSKEDMVAYTLFGGNHYWATKEQVKENCLYVIDEEGVRMLYRTCGDTHVILPIHISRKEINVDENRANRDADRVKLREESYFYVFDNDGSIEDSVFDMVGVINKTLSSSWWAEGWYNQHKTFLV